MKLAELMKKFPNAKLSENELHFPGRSESPVMLLVCLTTHSMNGVKLGKMLLPASIVIFMTP